MHISAFGAALRTPDLRKKILFTLGFANLNQAGNVAWNEKNLLTKPYRRAELSKRIDMLLDPGPG